MMSEPLVEDHLPTPVTLTSLPEKGVMAATTLGIIYDARSTIKDQSMNMVNRVPPRLMFWSQTRIGDYQ